MSNFCHFTYFAYKYIYIYIYIYIFFLEKTNKNMWSTPISITKITYFHVCIDVIFQLKLLSLRY